MMTDRYNRRDFLRMGAVMGAGLAMGNTSIAKGAQQVKASTAARIAAPMEVVRVGFVGVGSRGSGLVKILADLPGVEVKAICDIIEEKVVRMQDVLEKQGKKRPEGYFRSDTDYKRMCECEDIDMVITATPWLLHTPVCLAAMKAEKHAGTEVPAAVTIDECWQLVEASEKYNKYCIMIENCCYGPAEMMVLNMVRQGVLGELLHGECGYMHDLRNIKLTNAYEGMWRLKYAMKHDGNPYPTHGLSFVAQCMNINRGDRFEYLVSMSSKGRGLNLYAKDKLGADNEYAKQKYVLGDVNSSLIKTANGLTIVLQHDTHNPRPYSRINIIQGTKGIYHGYSTDEIYIEGKSPHDKWEPLEKYSAEYEHPLWKSVGKQSEGYGHGGMDYMVFYRLIDALHKGTEPDIDVYDSVAWSAPVELTERSVNSKSRAVDFPDFTRGKWKTMPPREITGA